MKISVDNMFKIFYVQIIIIQMTIKVNGFARLSASVQTEININFDRNIDISFQTLVKRLVTRYGPRTSCQRNWSNLHNFETVVSKKLKSRSFMTNIRNRIRSQREKQLENSFRRDFVSIFHLLTFRRVRAPVVRKSRTIRRAGVRCPKRNKTQA